MKHCGTVQHWRKLFLFLPILALLTGCGMGTEDTSTSGTFTLSGNVHGGQQAVTGGTIQLYTAGTSGNGSAATPMLTSAVVTDSSGNFDITGKYACVHGNDQIYITATGGNPGLTAGTNNNALVLMAAIGNCSALSTTQFLFLNEVTTVAAVYALAPFIAAAPASGSSYDHIGASSTNSTGLANAFLNAQLLANTGTGLAATPASGVSIQSGKLYALADAIAPCINSANSTSTNCTALVSAATPNGGSTPAANTLSAALSIVRHPGDANVVGPVFNLINSQAPYTTTLSHAPSDWTMTLTIANGGLNAPTALGVDTSGNVWVANYNGGLSAFTPQGAAFNTTGFGTSVLSECFGLTIDATGNVWVTNFDSPIHAPGRGSVSKFLGAASGTPGTVVTNTDHGSTLPYFYDSSINQPAALAADTNGNIGIGNFANSSATIYTSSGTLVTSGIGSGSSANPVAIAFDSSHGLWLANQGDSTVTHVSSGGSILAHPSCCSGADGIALDASGNAWIANYSGSYVYGMSPTGAGFAQATGGGLSGSQPVGIAVDAAQNIWVADGNGAVITELTDNGFAVSPSTGYGLDTTHVSAHGIVPDASGNIWMSDFGRNEVVMFFGLATPTVTPVQPVPTAP